MNHRKLLSMIIMISLLWLSLLTKFVGVAEAAGLENVSPEQTALTSQPGLILPPAVPSESPLLNNTPVLTITKSAYPDPVNAGEVLTYTIIVVNGTITDATNTVITDTLDDNISFAWASDGGTSNSGVVTWDTGIISGGQTITRTLLVTVGTSVTSGTLLSNTAGVTSTEGATDSDTVTTIVNTEVNLALTKTDQSDPILESGVARYTLTITNTGPSVATGVVLTDTLPSNSSLPLYPLGYCTHTNGIITCNLGSIANGGNTEVEIWVRPQGPGILMNQAEVTANEPDSYSIDNSDTEDTSVEPAEISVTKTDSPDPVLVGYPLTYTLEVDNNSPYYDATGIVLTDTLPPSVNFSYSIPGSSICNHSIGTVTCNLPTIDSLEQMDVTIVVTPTVAGTISNIVQVTSPHPDSNMTNNTFTETTTVDPVTDLSISKSGDSDPVIAGENLTYSVTITNNGPSDATGIVVTDTLPGDVTFTSASPGCSYSSGTVNCTLPNLVSGLNKTFTIEVKVDSSKIGTLSNSASVTGNEFDPDTDNNDSDTIVTTVDTEADLSISKSDSPDPVTAGENLTYSVTITNNGPSDATAGIVITDTLTTSEVTFISASPGCSYSSGTVNCSTTTNLVSGANKTFTIEVKVDSSKTGTLSNSASVSGNETDPDTDNNDSGTIVTTVDTEADLTIDKVGPATAKAGDPITYTLTINNNGPSDATGVVVTDTLPASATYLYASAGCNPVGNEVRCELGHLVDQAIETATIVISTTQTGLINNSVEVDSNVTDPTPGNNTDDAPTMITDPAADLFFVYLPIIMKAPPTDLYIENDTGGDIWFTVQGTSVNNCLVPAGEQNYPCGSFLSGTYTVQITSYTCPPPPTTTIPAVFFASGSVTKQVFCN